MLLTGGLGDLDRACDAAVDILRTRGSAALSVRAIAHTMNLTGPALTHRWDNKAMLCGITHSDDELSFRVAQVVLAERDLLARELAWVNNEPAGDETVDALLAAATGLRARVLSVGEPMPLDAALAAWRLVVTSVVGASDGAGVALAPGRGGVAGADELDR